jgi:non-specific serine/threonine protein kinase
VPVLEPGEARRLFVTRARAAQPDFEPDEHLDDLCARLDNLPLALELAAARTSLLTTGQLLDRLRGRLDLLQGGRDAETRQRTLRATIEWSYDLLDINERDLLAALSIFRGGWTLEAAEYVADADLELMQSLVDKSLVRHWVSGRFGMLETIREFAAERLEPQRHDVLRGRSLDYLLSLFEGANLRHRSRGQPQMELAQEERANVEAALRWAEESDPVKGLQLLDLQEMFWFTNDPSRAREHLDKLLAAAGAGLDPRVRMDALRLRGSTFYFSTGRHDLAEADYLSAIELARSIGDDDQAWHLSLRVAHCALEQGDVQRVKQLVAERLAHGGGYEGDQAVALGLLAKAAFGAGDVAEGARLAHDAARAAQAAGRTWWRAVTLMDTAEILALSGELDVAAADHAEGLRALWSVQDLVSVPRALMIGAVIAARRAQATRAGRLWGAAESDAARQPRPTTMQALAEYETHLAPVRGKDFDEARQYGRGLSLSAAVGYALGEVK